MDYFNQETERLVLRKVKTTDIESWVEFFEDNNSLGFLGIDLCKDKQALAKDWILTQLDRYADYGMGHLAIIEKESNKLIGMSGIIIRELDGQNEFEIAYSLKPAFWGKGYGTEAASQLKSFGFSNNIAAHFISLIHIENIASMNVAIKNGMKVLAKTRYLGMDVYVFGTK